MYQCTCVCCFLHVRRSLCLLTGSAAHERKLYFTGRLPSFQPLGCYHDSYYGRALTDNYANFRDQIIWKRLELTVNQCARVAQEAGYEYFAVQYYGECHSGKDAGKSYAKYGKSTKCWQFNKDKVFGVGKEWTNFVYRIK